VFVETCGTAPLVKWQRTISRVGKAGRERETRRERKNAEKRKRMPGRKRVRAGITVVCGG